MVYTGGEVHETGSEEWPFLKRSTIRPGECSSASYNRERTAKVLRRKGGAGEAGGVPNPTVFRIRENIRLIFIHQVVSERKREYSYPSLGGG